MSTAIAVFGDKVEVHWRDTGRRDEAAVEKSVAMVVTVRITGPPEIMITVPAAQLQKAGAHRWTLEL